MKKIYRMSKVHIYVLAAAGIILFITGFLVFHVVFKDDEFENISSSDANSESSFTFFGVGANTRYNEDLRGELRKSLGSDAIETRTTIRLEILYAGFIRQYFPEIYRLNQKLNENTRQRIEHNTTRLTYRYLPGRIKAFDYVELLFSNYSQKPLYCKIRIKNDASSVLEVLKSRYEEPEKIDWGKSEEFSLFWRKEGDLMVFSKALDKIGNPEFQIMIYYAGNIEQLIEEEKKQKEIQERRARDAIRKVF